MKGSNDILASIILGELEQPAQGSGRLLIPEVAQNTCGHGTLGLGFVAMVVLGWCLDWMILEVFSNLNDFMISEGYSPLIPAGVVRFSTLLKMQ